MLIYDGRTRHGVEEIDQDKLLTMDKLEGRLVVNLSTRYEQEKIN